MNMKLNSIAFCAFLICSLFTSLAVAESAADNEKQKEGLSAIAKRLKLFKTTRKDDASKSKDGVETTEAVGPEPILLSSFTESNVNSSHDKRTAKLKSGGSRSNVQLIKQSNVEHVDRGKFDDTLWGELKESADESFSEKFLSFSDDSENYASVTFHNPEVHMNTTQIISYWEYGFEEYDVTTADGYILKIVRILPQQKVGQNKTRPVVFLQHGLECSATDWLMNIPRYSAGFYFVDRGYDVWLGNFRGNAYSSNHVSLTRSDDAFWNFTWVEMAKYDLPAMVNKVLEVTKVEQLYYVGHSQGTLTFFAESSENKLFADKIRMMFAMAPVYTLKHTKGMFKLLSVIAHRASALSTFFGKSEFISENSTVSTVLKNICPSKWALATCFSAIVGAGGMDEGRIDKDRFDIILAHYPSGTSGKNVQHFMQLIDSGKCQMYDYGSKRKNTRAYGQKTPPVFNVSNSNVPTVLFYSQGDALSSSKDVEKSLIPALRKIVGIHKSPDYNHADYTWGVDAAEDVYSVITKYIEEARTDLPMEMVTTV